MLMSSIIRKGTIPHAPTGVGPYLDELYTLKGFFGDWAQLYRTRNLAHPKSWSGDDLMYNGADTNALSPSDADDPAGSPLALLTGDGIVVSLSRRAHAMPFAEKNADHHQIRFYHRGTFRLETELGALKVEAGDFVVIPQGLIYRETPETGDNAIVIFETDAVIKPAEELWDSVGFTSFFVDYSAMELPSPAGDGNASDVETEVRVKFGGEYHTLTYDFDPCRDVVGWLGDPVIYRLNVWAVPGAGTSHGFLPPPTGAVLIGEDKSFFFNVMSPKPFPTTPAPDGSYGAPAHLNDYDEVWFNHAADRAPDTDGHLWRLPPTLPHPGLKRPPEYPENPVQHIHEVKLNFDTKARLSWTAEAKDGFLADPQVAVYTSLYGAHIGVVPEQAMSYVKR
jgi:homogentisate 1,2-dioxygenase